MVKSDITDVEIIRSKKIIFTASVKGGDSHKLFQMIFPGDGSIYVNFPYFKHSSGIAARCQLQAREKYPTKINLREQGKATSHLVKYSHHPDGQAHFSQDGKVKTSIKKASVPIDEVHGHFFTVQIQDVKSFEKADQKRDEPTISSERSVLECNVQSNIETLKCLCFIYDWSFFKQNISAPDNSNSAGPIIRSQTDDNENVLGYLSGFPKNKDLQHKIIRTSFEEVELMTEDKEPSLIFLGGFDDRKIALDHSKNTEFLTLSYPSQNFDELQEAIGSIDL